jgi:hypothetical protein
MSRVAVLVAVAALVFAAGCSSAIGDPVHILPCTPSEDHLDKQMVLMAQSVPTASAVPCMRTTLDDWFLDDLDSWDGHTRIEFSRLIDQVALTISLTRTCDRGGASETATDQPGTRRFDERIRTGSSYRDRRFYLLPGACVTYEFGLTGAGAEEAAADISRAIGFVSRDQLADQVRRYSGACYSSTRSGHADQVAGRRLPPGQCLPGH